MGSHQRSTVPKLPRLPLDTEWPTEERVIALVQPLVAPPLNIASGSPTKNASKKRTGNKINVFSEKWRREVTSGRLRRNSGKVVQQQGGRYGSGAKREERESKDPEKGERRQERPPTNGHAKDEGQRHGSIKNKDVEADGDLDGLSKTTANQQLRLPEPAAPRRRSSSRLEEVIGDMIAPPTPSPVPPPPNNESESNQPNRHSKPSSASSSTFSGDRHMKRSFYDRPPDGIPYSHTANMWGAGSGKGRQQEAAARAAAAAAAAARGATSIANAALSLVPAARFFPEVTGSATHLAGFGTTAAGGYSSPPTTRHDILSTPSFRETLPALAGPRNVRYVFSESEIGDFDMPLGIDEEVLGFEVAVDDVFGVKVVKCHHDFGGVEAGYVVREALCGEEGRVRGEWVEVWSGARRGQIPQSNKAYMLSNPFRRLSTHHQPTIPQQKKRKHAKHK
ncbi:hypothetical protein HK104_004777 [Borealophlyctis nickersoniae]|nr:hypothetical protein HK104_004777 [Borealophlyctis nickersoniae]